MRNFLNQIKKALKPLRPPESEMFHRFSVLQAYEQIILILAMEKVMKMKNCFLHRQDQDQYSHAVEIEKGIEPTSFWCIQILNVYYFQR